MRKLEDQRPKMKDYIQKNRFDQNIEFSVSYSSITIGMHPRTVRDEVEHSVDLLGEVMRSLSWMKERL